MVFGREQFAAWDDEAGVTISMLGLAIVTWAAMQDKVMTVREAATTFNTTDDAIREAVALTMWIGLEGPDDDATKQRIELDGA